MELCRGASCWPACTAQRRRGVRGVAVPRSGGAWTDLVMCAVTRAGRARGAGRQSARRRGALGPARLRPGAGRRELDRGGRWRCSTRAATPAARSGCTRRRRGGSPASSRRRPAPRRWRWRIGSGMAAASGWRRFRGLPGVVRRPAAPPRPAPRSYPGGAAGSRSGSRSWSDRFGRRDSPCGAATRVAPTTSAARLRRVLRCANIRQPNRRFHAPVARTHGAGLALAGSAPHSTRGCGRPERCVSSRPSRPGRGGDPLELARRTGAASWCPAPTIAPAIRCSFRPRSPTPHGRIAQAVGPVLSNTRDPVAGIDEFRSRVMTALATLVDLRAAGTLATSEEIPPFDVYQAYIEGWDAFWHGDKRAPRPSSSATARRGHRIRLRPPVRRGTGAATTTIAQPGGFARRRPRGTAPRSGGPALDRDLLGQVSWQNEEMLRLSIERAEPRRARPARSRRPPRQPLAKSHRRTGCFAASTRSVDLAYSTDTAHVE